MENSNLDDSKTREVEVTSNNSEKIKNNVIAGEEVVLDEKIKDEQKIDEKTKKLLNKKIIIGIICILAIILCVVIYVVFLYNKNEDGNEGALADESNLLVKEKETYEGLNYTMEKENLIKLGFFYDYSKDIEGNKIDVSYIKISGLKDSTLEENINDKLKKEAESMYNESNVQDDKILYDHIYNYTDVYIFNNVLSTLYCEEKCDIDGNITYTYKGVNINLKEFEEFSLEDVFVNTANIEEIVSSQTDLSYSETLVFSVSPKFVYIVDESGNTDIINLYNNKDKVAIYKRFSENKKMFSKTYNASPYAFTTKKFIESDVYGLEEDNLFIDTCNLVIEGDYNDNVIEAVQSLYKEAVTKARNLSYANPSKRYLVQIIPTILKTDDNYNIIVKVNSYEISKQFFNDSIIEFVVESENKYDKEICNVDYFDDTVMNADDYLNKTSSEILTKEVDENGNEVKTNQNINENLGVS